MKLKIDPYPITLYVKLSDKLPFEVGGKVESINSQIIMVLDRKNWENYYLHETIHVKQAIEEYIETKLDDETEAYLVSFLAKKIYNYLKIKENKQKDKNKDD